MSKTSDLFEGVAHDAGIGLWDQVRILLTFIDDHAAEPFIEFVSHFSDELFPEPAEAATAPLETVPPQVAELNAFIDRDMAMASLACSVQLPGDGPIFERPDYLTARLLISQQTYAAVVQHLDGSPTWPEAEEGDILCGWHHIFEDGSIGAVQVVQGFVVNGGPYVDAFLILQSEIHPPAPNPSLEPRGTLDDDFVFLCPDGTYRVLQLVPSSCGLAADGRK